MSTVLMVALLGGISVGALALSQISAQAQSQQGGSGGGGQAGTTQGGQGDKGGKGGRSGVTQGQSGKSLRDIFNDMEDAAAEEASRGGRPADAGQGGKKGGQATAGTKGQKGKPAKAAAEEEEDSDRPEWAGVPGKEGKPGGGSTEPGTKKGDLYGDLWEILRDEDGVPILVQLPNGEWVVQPVAADGSSLIQYDTAGNVVVDADGNPVYSAEPTEVELGRLNVGRSPHNVLSTRYEDVIATINSEDVTSVSLDASGRLVLTTTTVITGDNPATPDVVETEYFATKTIDSPLENLAIYYEILTTGGMTGIDATKLTDVVLNLADTSGFTVEDFASAASFLAAGADKFGSLTEDAIVYMNSILKMTYDVDPDNLPAVPLVLNEDGTIKTIGDVAFIDYSAADLTYTYDRAATYDGVTVYVLVKQDDGTYKPELVDLYETVFGDTNVTATALDGFTQAADDALQVIEFVHEYEVPADSTATTTN
jgi:hypothetical protein